MFQIQKFIKRKTKCLQFLLNYRTRFKEPLWMKENDLNERIRKLKKRLSKLKNAHVLPEIPADRSPKKEQKMRPMRKIIYKKYNFETKL